MRKKRLRQIEDYISIKKSKENNQVQLSQRLKYKPVKCEDCDRMCPTRRIVYSKLVFVTTPAEWVHQCNQCRQYYNSKTKKFNTSWVGLVKRKV